MSSNGNSGDVNLNDDVLVSTHLVEDGLKIDFWREVTRPFYDTMPLIEKKSPRLEGAIKSRQVAGLQFGSVIFNAQRYNRDRRIIAGSGLDQYLITIVAADMSGDFAGTSITARPGDICVLDLTQILQSEVAAGGMFSVLMPRRALAKAVGYANLHGLILKAHLPMTKLLTAYLGGLSELEDHPTDDEAVAVQEALVTILAAALRGERLDDAADLRPLSAALRQRVLDFIDKNINKHELSSDFIISQFNVSRSHLYRAFSDDGGISTVIWNRRLDAAFLELTRADVAGRSITEIAFAHGFTNATHFLRRFRARFGVTPGEVRRQGSFSQLDSGLQAHFLACQSRACSA